VIGRLGRWLVAGIVLLLGRGRRRRPPLSERLLPPPEPLLPEQPPDRRGENAVLALLTLTALAAAAFIVEYALDANTQLLGLALAVAFAFLGWAAVLAGRRLVPQEEAVEDIGEREHPAEQAEAAQLVEEGLGRVSRRRLLGLAAGGAVGALGAALLVPAVSLGPLLETSKLRASPWRRGVRLVDEQGRAITLDELEVGSFLTAFPDGANRRDLAAPLVLVRLRPGEIHLPGDRSTWAPAGVLAFSKICTHAGCAVSLFRYPLFEPTSPKPALVCPCHYSTFDVGRGGTVIFGPAGRPLPQLPLALAADRTLVAAGPFSGHVGPSWWGVRG
jgi:ubiquinol-cytochrome c reductase iron-sulfur subunit